MEKIKNLKIHYFALIPAIFLVLVLLFTTHVFASSTSTKTPGEVIDATCSKEDVNCILKISIKIKITRIGESLSNTSDNLAYGWSTLTNELLDNSENAIYNDKELIITLGNISSSTSEALASGWSTFTNELLDNSINSLSTHKQFADNLSNNLTRGTLAYTNGILNWNDHVTSTLLSTKDLGLATTASVGDSLMGASNGISDGWTSFTNTIIDNTKQSLTNTKDLAISIWNNIISLPETIRNGAETFIAILNEPVAPTPTVSLPSSLVTTSTTPKVVEQPTLPTSTPTKVVTSPTRSITQNITQQQRDIYINQYDPSILPRIQGIELALQNTISHNTNQTDRVYDSIIKSINSSSNNITEEGILNDTTLRTPAISNGTLSGTTTIGLLATPGTLTINEPTTLNNNITLANNKYLGWKNAADTGETVFIKSTTADDLQFSTNGVSMTILSGGNTGIGAANPRTKLELGGDGSFLALGNYSSGWTEPNLGSGTRMFWYPKKAAFRAGSVDSSQWNDTNIGSYSSATNRNTTAKGDNSNATNDNTTADSYDSTAIGRWNVGGGNPTSWISTDPLFEVGNGTDSSSKANALTIYKNGNMQVQGNITGNLTGNVTGNLTGNADTVTNGIYTNQSYSNPTWLTAVPYSILSGTIPTWNQDTTGTSANFSGSLVGDVTGTQGATVVGDDSHLHTASTISGLSVSDFTSPNISNWTNDSAYINAGSTLTGLVQSTTTGNSYFTGGSLGVGTTSPGLKLSIVGDRIGLYPVNNTAGSAVLTLGDTNSDGTLDIASEITGTAAAASQAITFRVSNVVPNGDRFEAMRINNSGNVGIGTTSPSTKLHIKDSTSALIRLQTAGTGEGGIEWTDTSNSVLGSIKQSSNTGDITTYIGASPKMTVQYATGNVGIGTTTPLDKLNVSDGQISVSQNIVSSATYNWLSLRSSRTTDDYDGLNGEYAKIYLRSTTNDHRSGDMRFAVKSAGSSSLLDSLTIQAGGNVGIGTTAPVALGSTYTTLDIRGSDGGGFRFGKTASTNAVLYADVNSATLSTTSAIPLIFATNDTERVRILSNGNVGIGTTDPEFKFQAVSDAAAVVGEFKNTATNGYGLRITTYSTGSQYAFAIDSYGGGYSRDFVIKNDGNVGIGTETPSEKLHVAGNILSTNLAGTGNRCVYVTGAGILSAKAEDCGSASGADNMGNHTATQNIQLGNYWLSGDGGSEGVFVGSTGNVGVGTTGPTEALDIRGTALRISPTAQTGILAFGNYDEGAGYYDTGVYRGGIGVKTAGNYLNVAGYAGIVFNSQAGILGSQATRMFIDGTTGNVGVGTTTPVSKLDVNGAVNIADGNNLTWGGAYAANIPTIWGLSGASGYLNFAPSGSTNGVAMTMLNNGNVGIGTTTPDTKLKVVGTIYSDNNAKNNFALNSSGTNYGFIQNDAADKWSLGTGTDLATLGTPVLTWTKAGNVGIGTTTPNKKLELGGGGAFTPALRFSHGAAGYFADFGYKSDGNKVYLSITDGSIEKDILVANYSGNVGIGTTTPGESLTVRYTGVANTLEDVFSVGKTSVANMTAGGGGAIVFRNKNYSSDTVMKSGRIGVINTTDVINATNPAMVFQLGNAETLTEKMRITTAGNVGIGTTSPGYLLHLKSDIPYLAFQDTDDTNGSVGTIMAHQDGNMYFDANFNNTATLGGFVFRADGASKKLMTMLNNGNVGIGTTNPQTKLQIYQSTPDTDGLIIHTEVTNVDGQQHYGALSFQEYPGKDSNYSQIRSYSNVYSSWGSQLAFYVTSKGSPTLSEAMRIIPSGNVGIGTTIPGARLEVIGPGIGWPALDGTVQTYGISRFGSDNAVLDIGVNGSLGAWLQVTNKSSLDVRYPLILNPYGGNVGIGTTAPAAIGGNVRTLDIRSSNDLSSSGGGIYLGTSGGSKAHIYSQGNDMYIGPTSGYTFLDGGNVGIGTTAPAAKLDVSGTLRVATNADGDQMSLQGAGYATYFSMDATGFKILENSGLRDIRLVSNTGGVVLAAGATAWSAISDERLKDIIGNVENSTEKLIELRTIYYKLKSDNLNTRHLGLIAQDVQKVFPEAVSADAEGYLNLRYSDLIPPIINAIKELNLKVEDLSFLDNTKENSLGSLITNFLADMENNVTDLYASVIHSDKVETKMLCVGATCVTEDQFLEIVNKSGVTTGTQGGGGDQSPNLTPEQIEAARVAKIDADLATIKTSANALTEGNYTAESWTTFQTALADALALPEDTEANKTDKTTAITSAIAGLQAKEVTQQDPTCTAPQTLVDHVCTDPAPADPTCTAPQTLVDHVCVDA